MVMLCLAWTGKWGTVTGEWHSCRNSITLRLLQSLGEIWCSSPCVSENGITELVFSTLKRVRPGYFKNTYTFCSLLGRTSEPGAVLSWANLKSVYYQLWPFLSKDVATATHALVTSPNQPPTPLNYCNAHYVFEDIIEITTAPKCCLPLH